MNLRTRQGQEESIIKQVRDHGGFSVFWITENQRRACAAERLEGQGRIKCEGGEYPFMLYKVCQA